MKTLVLLFVLIAIVAGLIMLRRVSSKTAFTIHCALIFGMSFCMAFGIIGFWAGILASLVISLVTIYLDDIGILA